MIINITIFIDNYTVVFKIFGNKKVFFIKIATKLIDTVEYTNCIGIMFDFNPSNKIIPGNIDPNKYIFYCQIKNIKNKHMQYSLHFVNAFSTTI